MTNTLTNKQMTNLEKSLTENIKSDYNFFKRNFEQVKKELLEKMEEDPSYTISWNAKDIVYRQAKYVVFERFSKWEHEDGELVNDALDTVVKLLQSAINESLMNSTSLSSNATALEERKGKIEAAKALFYCVRSACNVNKEEGAVYAEKIKALAGLFY